MKINLLGNAQNLFDMKNDNCVDLLFAFLPTTYTFDKILTDLVY